jgi:hypothetical protein
LVELTKSKVASPRRRERVCTAALEISSLRFKDSSGNARLPKEIGNSNLASVSDDSSVLRDFGQLFAPIFSLFLLQPPSSSTVAMAANSALFDPLVVGDIKLSNRLALAPLTRFRNSDSHAPKNPSAEYYAQVSTQSLSLQRGLREADLRLLLSLYSAHNSPALS